jgi:hypothetical protein
MREAVPPPEGIPPAADELNPRLEPDQDKVTKQPRMEGRVSLTFYPYSPECV